MTDRVQPGARGSVIENIELGEMASQISDGWIVPADEPTLSAQRADTIDHETFVEFELEYSSDSLEVEVQPGEAFVNGWLARDEPTTVELEPDTDGQTIVLGWNPDAIYDAETHESRQDADEALIGLESEVSDVDPYVSIWSVDTDVSGVTRASDERDIGLELADGAQLNSLIGTLFTEVAQTQFEVGLDKLDFADGFYSIFADDEHWERDSAVRWNANDQTIELIDGAEFFDGLATHRDPVTFGVNREKLPDVEMTFTATEGDVSYPVVYFTEWTTFADTTMKLSDGETATLDIDSEQRSRVVVDISGGIGDGEGEEKWMHELNFGTVRSVAVSDRRVYSGDENGDIMAAEFRTGDEDETFDYDGHDTGVNSLVYKNRRLFSGGEDGELKIADSNTGEELDEHTEHEDEIVDVAASYEMVASVGDDGMMYVYNYHEETVAWSYDDFEGTPTAVYWWNEWFFVGDDEGEVYVLTADGDEFRQFHFVDSDAAITAIHADSYDDEWFIFTGDDENVLSAYDWFREEMGWESFEHSGQINSIWHSNGEVYSGSNDNSVRGHDVEDGSSLWTQGHHSLNVNSVVERNGVLFTGGTDNDVYASTVSIPVDTPELMIGDETVSYDGELEFETHRDVIELEPDTHDVELTAESGEAVVYLTWLETDRISNSSTTEVSYDDEASVSLYGAQEAEVRLQTENIDEHVELLWSEEVTDDENRSFELSDDGVLFFGGDDGKLIAFDIDSRSVVWDDDYDDRIWSLEYNDGVLYVGVDDDTVYAVDATDGSEYWSTEVDDSPSALAYGNGRVFVGTNASPKIIALRADDGSKIDAGDEEKDYADAVFRHDFHTSRVQSIVFDSDLLYSVGSDNNLFVTTFDDAVKQWSKTDFGGSLIDVYVTDEMVLAGGNGDTVYAYDKNDGTKLWEGDVPDTVRKINSVFNYIVVSGFDYLIGFKKDTGKKAFEVTDNNGINRNQVYDDVIYTGDEDGQISAYSAYSGLFNSKISFGEYTFELDGYEELDETIVTTTGGPVTIDAEHGKAELHIDIEETEDADSWTPYFHYAGSIADGESESVMQSPMPIDQHGRTDMEIRIDGHDADECRVTFEAPPPAEGVVEFDREFFSFFAEEAVGIADFESRPPSTGVVFELEDEDGVTARIDTLDEITEFASLEPKVSLRVILTRDDPDVDSPVLEDFSVYMNGEPVTEYVDVETTDVYGIGPGDAEILLHPGDDNELTVDEYPED